MKLSTLGYHIMDSLDRHNRSKHEDTETLHVSNLREEERNSTTSLRRLVIISIAFSVLALSAVMGLCCFLFTERSALHTMVALPHSLESTGPMVNPLLTSVIQHQSSHCLLESSIEDIQQRIENGESVPLHLKGYMGLFVAVAMDQNNQECFRNAQGKIICITPSTACEASPSLESPSRTLAMSDEEYDIRCKAYISTLDPVDWQYAESLVAECIQDYCHQLGCPCLCFNFDIIPADFTVPPNFVVTETPDTSASDIPSSSPTHRPTHSPTKRPRQCHFRNGRWRCPKVNP